MPGIYYCFWSFCSQSSEMFKVENGRRRTLGEGVENRVPSMFSASCTRAQNIRNAFGSAYNCTLCQNYKAPCGAAQREHWGKVDPVHRVKPKQKDCVVEHRTLPVHDTLFLKALYVQPRTCLSFRCRLICKSFPKLHACRACKTERSECLAVLWASFLFSLPCQWDIPRLPSVISSNTHILYGHLTLDEPVKMIASWVCAEGVQEQNQRALHWNPLLKFGSSDVAYFCRLPDCCHRKSADLSLNVFLTVHYLVAYLSTGNHYDCNNSLMFSSHSFLSQSFCSDSGSAFIVWEIFPFSPLIIWGEIQCLTVTLTQYMS